jgi:selenophosphate synthetase-related protein
VRAVRDHPGLRNKAAIGVVAEVFGASDWRAGPGDDGAVVGGVSLDGGGSLVVGGEAVAPAFVAADPFGAGVAAVVANVNDLAAMGAEPLAVVDTVVAGEVDARSVLEGMREAAAWYDVPVVGGHLTRHDGPPAVSAFAVGRAERVLSVRNARAGQRLVVASVTEGRMRDDFPFFPCFAERAGRLAGDVRLLAAVAAAGSCVAAKDVSMAGLVGSLAMLCEPGRLGVTVDIAALPVPPGVGLAEWLVAFPCYSFLLCLPPGREEECVGAFVDRDIEAAVVGTLDGSGRIALSAAGRTATVVDLRAESVTGLR